MTTTVQTERVLVVPTELFRQCGYFQGFSEQTDKYLPKLLDTKNTQYLPRGEMEENPEFKQLIPYCIFRHTSGQGAVSIFQYTRGTKAGEKRLRAKRSIGIGGHISTLDIGEDSPYDVGMRRELEEEVVISSNHKQDCVGMINDDETEVGKVHLGVVHVFDIESPDVSANESEIADAAFRPVSELLERIEEFETWSQICLQALFGANRTTSEGGLKFR